MPESVKESFQWMTPEFHVVDAGKHTIKIKGVAMKRNVVSRNKRKYVDEELKKAARTWIGKPVTINHDMRRIVGDVKWMEYEDGALEYLADIKKEPYVSMLRDKSTSIRGVSIEANYLHNRCPQCGEKFYTEADFHTHMREQHFIKTDPTREIHGMYGTALSLVLSPEEPGYAASTVDLMETYERPVLQLLETVIQTVKERNDYMKAIQGKAALQPQPRVTIDAAKQQAKEQDEDIQPGSHYCETHPDDPRCQAHKQAIHGDEAKTKEQDETPTPPCPEEWHEVDGHCVKDEAPTTTEQEDVEHGTVAEPDTPIDEVPPGCPDGFHLEGDDCVPNSIPAQPEMEHTPKTPDSPPTPTTPGIAAPTVTVEMTLPPLLKLGEPFAGYTDFDDCVAKNADKDDPHAYCADIKNKVEGEPAKETAPSKDIYETLTTLTTTLQHDRRVNVRRDAQNAEAINRHTDALNQATAHFIALREDAKRLHQELGRLSTTMTRDLHAMQTQVNQQLGSLATAHRATTTHLASHANTLTATRNAIKAFDGKVTEQKRDFEKILQVADDNAKQRDTRIKTLETRLKELEAQEDEPPPCPEGEHRDATGKCVPDTPSPDAEETQKQLQEIFVKLENIDAKFKGQFKGHTAPVKASAPQEYAEDPNKAKRK